MNYTVLDISKRIIVENNFFILFLVPSLALLRVESFFLLCNRLYGVRLIIFIDNFSTPCLQSRHFYDISTTEASGLRR